MSYQEPLRPFVLEDVPEEGGEEKEAETPAEEEVKGDEKETDESEEEL